MGFITLDDVRVFFREQIKERNPPGKFNVTKGSIAPGGLRLGEPLIFSYQAQAVFLGRAGSGLIKDDQADVSPSFFVVDVDSLREVDEGMDEIERRYNAATGTTTNITKSQGWNHLPDSAHTEALWSELGGGGPADRLGANEADSGDTSGDSYAPDATDRRRTIERQIRERRGQKQFRDALRNKYGNRCLVTGCTLLEVVEAAHINPYRGPDDNHPENGLLLRSDLHTLFDLDLLGFDPKTLSVELNPAIEKEYGQLRGTKLSLDGHGRPSFQALQIRYDRFRERLGQRSQAESTR